MSGNMYGAYPDNHYAKHNEWPYTTQFNTYPTPWRYPNYGSNEVELNPDYMHRDGCGGGLELQSVDMGWMKGRGSWNGKSHGNYTRGPPGNRHMRQRGHGNRRFSDTVRSQPSYGNHFCDSCDRGFPTADDLQNHSQNDHVICGLDGCTLSAHPKIVEKHQKMQHATGLYSRIASMSSQSPEEVKKWIADRKKNYPTKENIERRKQEEAECIERGESLGLRRGGGSRFGRHRGNFRSRGRGRGGFGNRSQEQLHKSFTGRNNEIHKRKHNRKSNKNSRQKREHETNKEHSDEKMEDEENRTGIPMFPGTASVLGVVLEKPHSSDEEIEDAGDFSDTEWMEETKVITNGAVGEMISEPTGNERTVPENNSITINNALGMLMGTYASDDSDEEHAPVKIKIPLDRRRTVENKDNTGGEKDSQDLSLSMDKATSCQGYKVPLVEPQEKKDEEEDSAPEEISIVKGANIGEGLDETRKQREVEERNHGGREEGMKRTRRGKRRGRSKGSAETGKEVDAKKKSVPGNLNELGTMVQKTRFPTLLEELLKNEIRHERNVILQCIRYITQKNFFDPSSVVAPEVDPKANENIEKPEISETQNSCSKVDVSVSSGHESSIPETSYSDL